MYNLKRFYFFALIFLITTVGLNGIFESSPMEVLGRELNKIPDVVNENTLRTTDVKLNASNIVQNYAFAHLTITGDQAQILAGFTHPDDLDEPVMIEWSLYTWNVGEAPIPIIENVRQTNTRIVEVNINLSLTGFLEFDYYLLVCKDKIQNLDGTWLRVITSESRYSRIAPYNGIWERTGEVTSSSAILHTYLTEKPAFDATYPDNLRVPPMAGSAQFIVYKDADLQEIVTQSGFYPVDDYVQVTGEWHRTNYNFRWSINGLEPNTQYFYLVETMSSDGLDKYQSQNINSFKTAPTLDADQPISFVVAHCLDVNNTAYEDPLEGAERGLKVFDSMLTFSSDLPEFIIMQGDTVYYDGGNLYAPDVGEYPNSEFIRRWLYWYAQYQFDNLMYFFQRVPGYWMVDDHDYWINNINEIKPDGWHIFRNVNPTPGEYGTIGETATDYYNNNPYNTSQGDGTKYWRSIKWGQHLELFIEEGRHHREADLNLIWGDEQRAWLEQKIRESNATYKIIATTTTMLGPLLADDVVPTIIPDKHANQKFRGETELFLNNILDVENVFFITGDNHYKHHSIINSDNYPALIQYNEFGSGSAAAPPHATSGGVLDSDFASLVYSDGLFGPGASAGYLRVDILPKIDRVEIVFKLIRVTADLDNDVVYQWTFTTDRTYPLFLPFVSIQ